MIDDKDIDLIHYALSFHAKTGPASMEARAHDNATRVVTELRKPVDMIIFCTRCGVQHIDEAHGEWNNPPHKTHECQSCGWKFRVADIPTNGVRELKTHGQSDDRPVRNELDGMRIQAVRIWSYDPDMKQKVGPPRQKIKPLPDDRREYHDDEKDM